MVTTMVKNATVRSHPRKPCQSDLVGIIGIPLMLALSSNVWSDELTVSPSIVTKETYNDNVFLSQPGFTTSSWITELTPQLVIKASEPSFKLNFNYELQNLHYAGDAHAERTNQMLDLNSTSSFVKNLLYLDANAAINQQNSTPFAGITNSNATLSANRLELRTYSVAPYLKTNFAQEATGELRFSRDSVNTSLGSLYNSNANTVKANLKSGPSFATVDWNVQYLNEKILYEAEPAVTLQNGSFGSGYHFSSEFAINGSVGYEKNNYPTTNGTAPQGNTWSAGFTWTPTDRTSLSVTGTKHYYGDTYTVAASERTFASVWSLGYNEGLITSRDQFLIPATTNTSDFLNSLWQSSITNPEQRQQAIDAFIHSTGLPNTLTTPVNTVTNQVFLQKSLQASVAVTGAQNTVIFSLFDITRDEESLNTAANSTTNLGLLSNTKQTGGNILWTLNFSPRTSAVFMDGYNKAKSASNGITYTNNNFTTTLNHQLDPKLRVSLEFQHLNNSANFNTGNFRDNLVSFTLLFSL